MAYRGLTAEVPLGQEGLTGSKNLAVVRPTQLLKARNITYESGTLMKEPGSVKYNATPISGGPAIRAGWDWWPSDGVQRMVVACGDGKVYKDDGSGAFATTLVSGLTLTATVTPIFVEGGKEAAAGARKLFLFTGVNAVQVLSADAATMAALATPPADWSAATQPLTGLNHEGRLWGAGNLSDPHRWYYSQTGNHEAFTGGDSGSISVYPGEGERIVAGCSYKGFLLTWKKPAGVYYVDTTNPTSTNWKVKRLSSTVGADGPLGFVALENDVLFWWQGDLWLVSTAQESGDVQARPFTALADLGTFLRENTNKAEFPRAQAIYHGHKRKVHVAVAAAGSVTNDRRLVADLSRPETIRFSFSDLPACAALWLRRDGNGMPQPVAGNTTGTVRLLEQAARLHDSMGYAGEFQTPYMDLSFVDAALAAKRKRFQFLELHYEPQGEWNLSVDILIDGETSQTLQFSMGAGGAALGSFVLDTDKLGGDQVKSQRKRVRGLGHRISLQARNSGAGENFSLARAFLSFMPAGERTA